ncbi:capsular polysaccharide export protein, LipB/KpsS family [Thiocystis violacea]|uniref:capsular polysaccharide export protein, LipB/KpsS family n=1 Tax=Thiocystis violacea TaxID=13725 RepID=UPI001906A7B3|nr:capsular biosynthesis protein [Thiocystis violacea]MBK1721836.1 capsular biosynthesis protein [Thiocystis violacea]
MSARAIAFIDPGPNLAQYLSAVGDRLPPGYRPVYFALRVKSRSVLQRLGRPLHPARRGGKADWPEQIQIDRDQLIARLRKTADKALVSQQAPAFHWLVRELDDFLERTRPTGIFLWNGSGLAAAITEQLARARGIPLVFGENGYLPNTLQLDPQGVNAFSVIGQDIGLDAIRALPYTAEQIQELDALLDAYRAGNTPKRTPPTGGRVRPSPLAYLIQAWDDWREREPSVKGNRLIPREIPPLPERFVFFPLQVRSDSQLTIHSPLYGNRLDAAIADLDAALRVIDPTLKLVIKLHPADLGKTDYDPVVRRHPHLIWVGGGDVRAILRRAACVVTVNSTVGIEGMIYGKPVVALGDNFYVREGLVHPVRDTAELSDRLRGALEAPPDTQLIAQYLRYLYFHAFARAHWRDYSEAALDSVAERILSMISRAQ